jgi:hypothetical protein
VSTVLADIEQALEVHAATVLTPIFAANIAWPNLGFSPTAGTPYAKVDHLHAPTGPAGAGIDAPTRRRGVFQVSLFFPEGTGRAGILAAAQAVNDGFQRGLSLSKNDTLVRVQGVSPGPYLNEEGWLHQPLSVSWLVHSSS